MIPKKLVRRLQTYRGTPDQKIEAARRSFYKLVSKKEAYSPARKQRLFDGSVRISRYPSCWTYGMPTFGSTRGALMKEWEWNFYRQTKRGKELEQRRKELESAQIKKWERESEFWENYAKWERDNERESELRRGAHRLIRGSTILDISDVPDWACDLQNLMTECKRTLRETKTKKEHK